MRKTPITHPIAAMLANGCKNDKKPTTVNTMPSAVNQPHPETPNLCSSNEFANFEIPEKISHIPNINGRVNAVNHLFPNMNNDKRTVRIPSTRNHPDPVI